MKRSQSEFSSYHGHISKVHCQWPSSNVLFLQEDTENRESLNTSFNSTKSSVFNDSGYSSFLETSPQKSPINYKKQAIRYFSPLNTPKFGGNSSENEPQNVRKEETINKKKIGRVLFSNDNNLHEDRKIEFEKGNIGMHYNENMYGKKSINHQNNNRSSSFSSSNHSNILQSNDATDNFLSHRNYFINNASYNTCENDRSALSPDTFLQTFDEEQWLLRGLGIITNDSDYLFLNGSKMDIGEEENSFNSTAEEDVNTPSPIKRFIEEERRYMEKRNKMYKNISLVEDEARHLVDISCSFRAENPDKTLYNQIKCRKFNILREKDRLRQIETEKKYYEEKAREEAEKAKEISKEMTIFLQMVRARGKKLFPDSFVKYCFAKTPEKEEILRRARLFIALYGDGSNNENIPLRTFAKQR